MSNGPKKGEGWGGFLDDEEAVWYDAFETTTEDGTITIDVGHYDEFDNLQELVNFVAGTGSYEDRNSFTYSHEDKEMQLREFEQEQAPQCPRCLEEVDEALSEDGVERSEVDINPRMEVKYSVDKEEVKYNDDYDFRHVRHVLAYCDEHEQATFFDYEETWFGDED